MTILVAARNAFRLAAEDSLTVYENRRSPARLVVLFVDFPRPPPATTTLPRLTLSDPSRRSRANERR